jgi:hypothetical protein
MLVLISSHQHQKFVQTQKLKLEFLYQQAIEVMLDVKPIYVVVGIMYKVFTTRDAVYDIMISIHKV